VECSAGDNECGVHQCLMGRVHKIIFARIPKFKFSDVVIEMADITTLDLAPYGINRVLYSGLKEWKAINQVLVARAKYAPGVVTIDDIPYTLKKKLGAGTFGTTFSAKTPDGKIVALKWVKNVKTPFDIQMILREVVIQILLAEFSRKETNGPYVPEIYKVAYDFTLEAGIIVSEMMENTAHNLIASSSVADNNVIVPDMLSQVSESLDFFQKHLKFNHRDLKADNIMYTRNASGKRIYKLIDFGFSCLKWRSLEIKAGQYYSQEAKCFRKERDLAQLCYHILRYLGGNFDLALGICLIFMMDDIMDVQLLPLQLSIAQSCMVLFLS